MTALLPLIAKGAQTSHRGRVLVGPVDLTLDAVGATAVMGPNGSGKTTLLRLLHGAARLTAGSLQWACGIEEARNKQAFVFQRPVMLRRSVQENIAYPLLVRGMPKSEAREKAETWAQRIGLGHALSRPATVLSGGEQQKLALARAMIFEPEVLFLDEPSAALDDRAKREIEDILQASKRSGVRLIFSTHDVGQARRLADDVIFLMHGKVHEKGAADAFFESPETAQAQAFIRGDIVE